jgi:hypothetical protein
MDFLSARKGTGFDRFDAAVLAVYTCVLGWAIPHHLPWTDEAQSWLLARDNSLRDLLLLRLHYEGAPGLWPLPMWVLTRLHLPYASINWLSGGLAVAGTFLLLRYSPFPRTFRWLLPFTFFLAYQYAVIARPYALFPLLTFGLCTAYTLPRPRPVLVALLAGLMVNVSLHSAIFGGLFALLYLAELLPGMKTSPGPAPMRKLMTAMGVFVVLSGLAVAVAAPAPDVAFADITERTSKSKVHMLLEKMIPEQHLPPNALPLDPPFPETPVAYPEGNRAQAFVWRMTHSGPRVVRTLMYRGKVIPYLSFVCFPIARSNVLAIGFLACFLLWLWSRRRLLLAVPCLFGAWLCLLVYTTDHHTGQFAVAMIGSVWIALRTSTQVRGGRWIQPLFAGVALLVILLQIQWTVHCVRVEAHSPYDPGRATEEFLASNFAGKRVAGFGIFTASAQPYADHNLFFNWDHAYWVYSKNTWTDLRRTEVLRDRPDAVVVGGGELEQETAGNQWMPLARQTVDTGQLVDYWQKHGYRETHRFCGSTLFRLGKDSTHCEFILEPAPEQTPPSAGR